MVDFSPNQIRQSCKLYMFHYCHIDRVLSYEEYYSRSKNGSCITYLPLVFLRPSQMCTDISIVVVTMI